MPLVAPLRAENVQLEDAGDNYVATEAETAFAEIAAAFDAIPAVPTTAAELPIADPGEAFDASDVEAALAELAADIAGIGASDISVLDAADDFDGDDVEVILAEIAVLINQNAAKVLPAGGSTGQMLAKIDGDDYSVQWVDPSAVAFDHVTSDYVRYVHPDGDDGNDGLVPTASRAFATVGAAVASLPDSGSGSGQKAKAGYVFVYPGTYNETQQIIANRELWIAGTGPVNATQFDGSGVVLVNATGQDYLITYAGVGGDPNFTDFAHMLRMSGFTIRDGGYHQYRGGFGTVLEWVRIEDAPEHAFWMEAAQVTCVMRDCSAQRAAERAIFVDVTNGTAMQTLIVENFQTDDNGLIDNTDPDNPAVIHNLAPFYVLNDAGSRVNRVTFRDIEIENKRVDSYNNALYAPFHMAIFEIDTGANTNNPINVDITGVRALRSGNASWDSDPTYPNSDAVVIKISNAGGKGKFTQPVIKFDGVAADNYGHIIGDFWDDQNPIYFIGDTDGQVVQHGIPRGIYRGDNTADSQQLIVEFLNGSCFYVVPKTGVPTHDAPDRAIAYTQDRQFRRISGAWTPFEQPLQQTVGTGTYALDIDDNHTRILFNAGTTVTLPDDATVDIPVGGSVEMMQLQPGQVTFTAGGTATINVPATYAAAIAERYGIVTAIKYAADTWVLKGHLDPV